jgi:hypothetical protein
LATLEYQSRGARELPPGQSAARASFGVTIFAAVVVFAAEIGFGTTKDFVTGFILMIVVWVSWLLLACSIIVSVIGVLQSRCRRGLLALLLGIAVLAISWAIMSHIRGPSLGDIH